MVLQSRTDRLRFLRPIQTALGLTGLVAVLLATGIGYAIARTVTRPLAAITATMKEIAATGDLTRKIVWRRRQWEDEDARLLAGTFNALTDSVARFQREAAERERLSALGRLSTVIAHEVRNPLMIIKASLRPLQREPVSAEDVRAAVVDINDEVERLNHLVDDVLDFARPIRYELAEADVNRICEESAAAAGVGVGAAHLVLDPALPRIVTDAGRLRSVLVNILVNAGQAVQAAAERPGAPHGAIAPERPRSGHDIVLTTALAQDGRLAITVRDRGVGIPAQELARVSEPYFTTKRGGTGLGLAISRNIIEGLGGTITVASQVGVGTEVTVDLPLTAVAQSAGNP